MNEENELSTRYATREEPAFLFNLKQKFKDKKRNLKHKLIRKMGGVPAETSGNLYSHAKAEMDIVWPESDEMQDLMKENILDLIAVFSEQGHSGFSANYLTTHLTPLMSFKTLGPLTGNENEWTYLNYSDELVAQNKRDSRVFRRADGSAYFIDGKIFVEPSGCAYTGSGSCVDIEFPCTPESEYVYLTEEDMKERE